MVWKLEREKLKRRVHGGKGADGEMVRNFLAKLHSNYFSAAKRRSNDSLPSQKHQHLIIYATAQDYQRKLEF